MSIKQDIYIFSQLCIESKVIKLIGLNFETIQLLHYITLISKIQFFIIFTKLLDNLTPIVAVVKNMW